MKTLRWLREQGEMMNREEFKLFVPMTVEESVKEFLLLYKTFAAMAKETQDLARKQDEIYFTEIARRIARAKKRRKNHAEPVSQRRALPKAP